MTIDKITSEYEKIATVIDRIRSMVENTRPMIDELTHIPGSKTTKLYYHIDNLIEYIDNSDTTLDEIQNQLNKYTEAYGDESDFDDYEDDDFDDYDDDDDVF